MAIVMPIVTQYSGKGLNQAITEISKAEGAFGKVAAASKLANVAMGAALVAAGAFAVKLGVDGVKAAVDEEAAIAKLNQTLTNLGQGASLNGVNKFIDDLQFATGVSDDQLRPAFERLVRSTGSVEEAQRALGIATDVAAGKGKSLEAVANAMGKAYDGNTNALGRLGLGLSETTLKSGDVAAVTGELSNLFKGQAATAADTFAGRLNILNIGFKELQESFGVGFLNSFAKGADGAGTSAQQMARDLRQMQTSAEQLGTIIGNVTKGISFGFQVVRGSIVIAVNEILNGFDLVQRAQINMNDFLGKITDQEAEHQRALLDSAFAARETAKYEELLGYKFGSAGNAAAAAVPQIDSFTAAAYGAGAAAATIYTGGTPTAGYGEMNYMVNATARVKAMAKAAKEAAANARSAAGGVKSLGDSAGKTYPQVEKLTKWIEGNKKNLSTWSDALQRAKDELANYAAGMKATFVELDLKSAFDAVGTWAKEAAKLDEQIADAIASGDKEGQAKAAAKRAAMGAALTWTEVFAQDIKNSKLAQQSLQELMGKLNPADTLGNKLLIDRIMGLNDPALIKQAADDLVKNGLGPEFAASLSSLDAWTTESTNAFAQTFYQPGVTAAQTQYDAIAKTLEANLANLYKWGRKLGKSVMDGYNSIVNGLPADVKLPKAMQSTGGLQAGGAAPITVNITSGIGNPVQIAREVRAILNSSQVRLGVA